MSPEHLMPAPHILNCRSCGNALDIDFVDLGLSPISNAFPKITRRRAGEFIYPLKAYVCSSCRLVQLEDVAAKETHFNETYAYFSSVSQAWLKHASDYTTEVTSRLSLGSTSQVIEIASNDGYLLRNFVELGIPCLGIDPAANCAAAAKERHGVETIVGFFGSELADDLRRQGMQADLIIANNVLAHVPDLNDFVASFKALLGSTATATFEFPHLLELIGQVQFDTIYHEHYSYISLFAAEILLSRHGLRVYDVQKLSTHGGSLRLFVCHAEAAIAQTKSVATLRAEELAAGIGNDGLYTQFGERVRETKRNLLKLLIQLKSEGARICAYGAAAKGTTLLNYCGIGTDFLDFVADKNEIKQGRFMPGTALPIVAPDAIRVHKPDYMLILPWNIADEIVNTQSYIREWGGRFIVPIPDAKILD